MSDWDQRAFCKGCGARDERYGHDGATAYFANEFNAVCRSCGMIGTFEICVARWVSAATWWMPWTWPKGHWEKKEATC